VTGMEEIKGDALERGEGLPENRIKKYALACWQHPFRLCVV